jgi:hypothetical protein
MMQTGRQVITAAENNQSTKTAEHLHKHAIRLLLNFANLRDDDREIGLKYVNLSLFRN